MSSQATSEEGNATVTLQELALSCEKPVPNPQSLGRKLARCQVGVGLITDVKDFNVTCLSSLGQIDQSPFKKVGVSLRNEGEIFHVNTLRKKRNWVSESSYSRGITWDSSGQARTYQSRELTELERRQELGDISCSYPKKRFERAPNNLYYHYRRNDECMRAGKENLPLELKR